MRSFWTKLAIVFALVGTVSCGKLPRPFEPGVKELANPLLHLNDNRGVVVAPIYNAPPELSAPLADVIAKELRLHDIPATSADILRAGNLLEGWYRLADSRAGRVDVIVVWILSDHEGEELFEMESRKRVLIDKLAREPALGLKEIVKNIVPSVVRALIGERRNGRAEKGIAITLGKISGAPGDGDTALQRAVRAVLNQMDISIADRPEEAIAHLQAQVEVKSQNGQNDQVRLIWTIRDSEQKFVASLTQQNLVPKGRLDRRWGSVAFDIALAIRPRIVEAVRHLGDSKAFGLAVPPTLK
ncbi:MAG: hypothetical protein VX430_08520 [Pseudomonadota bacterium]|nr:hypothetical protein [Pseudomonadota bacterium]